MSYGLNIEMHKQVSYLLITILNGSLERKLYVLQFYPEHFCSYICILKVSTGEKVLFQMWVFRLFLRIILILIT